MDDFIYFLLVIGWLGYSIYRQSEKKKRLLAERRSVQQDPAVPDFSAPVVTDESSSNAAPVVPDFKKTLEEFLLGKQLSLEDVTQNEAQSLEVIPEQVVSDEDRYQNYTAAEGISKSSWYENTETQALMVDEKQIGPKNDLMLCDEEESYHFWDEFDLRNAVIYSEILNRRFVH